MPRLLSCCLCLLLLGALSATEHGAPAAPVPPSANHGRLGNYQASTSIAAYNYYVCVPKSYDENHPAGLHLFFHGQNNQGAAKEWDRWQKPFLEPFDLIGINMEFTDGDNFRDQDNKVKATLEAIAQVNADYKIIAPRGAIVSFSGGGVIHAMLGDLHGRTRSAQWPFCHSTSISSSYDRDPSLCVPMSWCVLIGTEEWSLFNIGGNAVKRAAELYQASLKGGIPDIRFLATHRGHTITESDLAASAACFAISDLAFGAFLYAPDYADKELRPIVEQANRQQPTAAGMTLGKLLAKPTLAPALRTRAEALQAMIDERQARIVTMLSTLPQSDPVLAAWYGPLLLAQLKGHAQEKELKGALMAAAKNPETQATLTAHAELARQFSSLFGPGGNNPGVVADKRPLLSALAPHLPATSRDGIMVAELLALTP